LGFNKIRYKQIVVFILYINHLKLTSVVNIPIFAAQNQLKQFKIMKTSLKVMDFVVIGVVVILAGVAHQYIAKKWL
jgi:hypothetical protein